jgi:hypothetical protein
MDELPWDLERDEDGSVYLQWKGPSNPVRLNLGPFDAACEKLAGFLAHEDFGE